MTEYYLFVEEKDKLNKSGTDNNVNDVDLSLSKDDERSPLIPRSSCVDVERVCDLFNGKKPDDM